MKSIIFKSTLVSIAALSLLAATATAGSLTPPGAPAPTMKTLDEVEARIPIHDADLPLTINSPGSYYLAENITFPTINTTGINIFSPGVTIDLNGFTLQGPGSASGTVGNAIRTPTPVDTITITNGTVRDWAGHGLNLTVASTAIVEKITAIGNGDAGIAANDATVMNCRAEDNGGAGIVVSDGVVTNSYCAGNDGTGIMATIGALKNNLCLNNDEGIAVGRGAIIGNTCNDNTQRGISGSSGCLIKDNTCSGNNTGISVEASDGTIVIGNVCRDNTGSGILSNLPTSSNRIEGNTVSGNGTGITLGGDSIAVKNMLHGNSASFNLSGGGVTGPILDLTASSTISSEHPWANFVY